MFIYHGIIDQVTSSLVEFIVIVLPSRVEVGSPFIVLCQRGIYGLLSESLDKDAQAPSAAPQTFEAVIETMSIALDGKAATFTSKQFGFTLHLPKDMTTLHLSFQMDSQRPPLSCSMALAMHHPLSAERSRDYVPVIFREPLYLADQFQGNLIALVLSQKKQEEEASSPMHACICWNGKVATTGETSAVPGLFSHTKELEVGVQAQDGEQERAYFSLTNKSHDFQGKLSQCADGKCALDLSLRIRHGLSGSTDWTVATIPQLEKHQETLMQMVTDFSSSGTVIIENDSTDVVSCTVESSTDERYTEAMTNAGLVLACLGCWFTAPQLVAAAVGAAGFLITAKSWVDTLWSDNTSKTMLLYPQDKMQQIMTGWATNYDIIMVLNHIEDNGKSLTVTSYRIPKVKGRTYKVTMIPHWGGVKPTDFFSIPFRTPQKIHNRRLLGIRGLIPDVSSGSMPDSLYEGDVVSYNSNGALLAYYESRDFWGWSGDYYFRCGPDAGQIAIVQGDNVHFGPRNNVRVYHLAEDPYTPVVYMEDAAIVFEGPGRIPRNDIGSAKTNDEVLKLIQAHQRRSKYPENWGYCHEYWQNPPTVYAWRWTAKNLVKRVINRNTYFVVGPESWTHTAILDG
ncbi:uncharacterized protein FTJAE_5045 [Fusarium tjaetaba]|uniref:Uncharacterized protein n=1 Tax=Fusarium tjaetaba TaxID=1567544 RepID=A0A8H5VZ91_9HYPO|nr:uncharacterized protein FTJAE_5045 [Fusarium tjaetaba]KAF5638974.1 hypothetical protein FTJAE_5045 [Fusarium tjaetaba]